MLMLLILKQASFSLQTIKFRVFFLKNVGVKCELDAFFYEIHPKSKTTIAQSLTKHKTLKTDSYDCPYRQCHKEGASPDMRKHIHNTQSKPKHRLITHSRIMADNLYRRNSVKFPTCFVWRLSLGVYIWSCLKK